MIKYIYRKFSYATVFLTVFAVSGIFPSPLPAQDVKKLSWQDCIHAAEMNNPDLISAREKVIQYASDRKIVISGLLPQISASASGTRSRKDSGISGGDAVNSYSYGVSAKQLIFDGFKSVYDVKGAGADLDAARFEYQVTSSEVRYNLRKAYISMIKAKEMLAIAEEITNRRNHIYELVKMRYNAGKEHIGSLHSVQADLMQAKADAASASRDLALANTTLCHLMGYDGTARVEVGGKLEITAKYSGEPDFALLAGNTPAVKKSALAAESAYYALKSSRLDYSPRVYGNASAGRQGETLSEMSNEWSVGFEITAPLFEGGKTYYSESKADSLHRQALSDQRSVKNTTVSSLREAWNSLKNSIDNLDAESMSLKASTERSNIGEMQYTIGTLSFDNWTIIENNLASAKKSYLNACAAAMDSEAQWIQSKGETIENETQN